MAKRVNKPKSQFEISSGKEKVLNRALQTRRDNDNVRDYTIKLQDIDAAVLYYLQNVILINVDNQGNSLKIPIEYASPEKWKSVRFDGYYKDQSGKIKVPIILFRRTSMDRVRDLSSKIDANNPQLYVSYERRWSKKNAYSAFSRIHNITPERELYNVIIPEYMSLTYEFIIWTDDIEQMNNIVEAIIYSEGSYWGEPERFKFRTRVDTYDNTVELPADNDRIVRTSFTLTIQGYLVSDAINKKISNFSSKTISTKILKFGIEVDGLQDTFYSAPRESNKSTAAPSNTTVNNTAISSDIFDYLNTVVVKNSDSIIGTDTAQFDNTSILTPPVGYPQTFDKNTYTFFIQGQVIPPTLVLNFGEVGSAVQVQFDTGSMGYSLDSNDKVTVVGKFVPPSDNTL